MSAIATRIAPIAVLAGLFGAWELAARWDVLADLLSIEPFLIPAPSDVAVALADNRVLLAENGWVTLREVLGGFAVALALGLGAALALHSSEPLRRAVYPLVVGSQTIPIIVVAPIFVAWFGFGIGPKIAVIALICFFPIAVNVLDGLATVDADQRKLMRSLGASRRQMLFRLELPTALPFLFSGAKIAVAVAVIGAVFGEWSGSDAGLGHLILIDNAQLEVDRVFAEIAVLSAMAIALFAAIALLERRFAWWGRTRPRDPLARS